MIVNKFVSVINEIPVVNLVPLVTSVIKDIPDAWNDLPEEKKKEIIQNLLIAGAKMAAKSG